MMSLRTVAGRVVGITLRMATAFIAFMLVYLVWLWWDMGQLRTFCENVRAGTPVSQLPQIADRHGVNRKWLKGDGAFNERTNQWSYYVPSTASVGANVCAIRHNKVTVISTIVQID